MGALLSIAITIALAALVGCSSMKVSSHYGADTDFSHYKTWNWLPEPPSTPVPTDSTITDPKVLARIQKAIEDRLIAQGHPRTDDAPDFFVKYHAALKANLTQTTIDDRYDDASYAGYTQDWQTQYTYEWNQGSLIIDVLDAQSAKLVWRGFASAEINTEASFEDRQKRIKEAVAKILEKFPPKTK